MNRSIATLGLVLSSVTASAAQIELLPSDDTQIVFGVGFHSAEPDTNFGAFAGMGAQTSRIAFDWDRIARSLLKFDLSAWTPGLTITAARLELSVSSTTSNPVTIELHRFADDSWVEETTTWNNPPQLAGSTLLVSRFQDLAAEPFSGPSAFSQWSIPLAGPDAWDWQSDVADGFVSFMFKVANDTTTTPNRGVGWLTKEGSVAPRLVLEYTVVPVPAVLPLFMGGLIPLLTGLLRRRAPADAGCQPPDHHC
jgi:hypothetical protein